MKTISTLIIKELVTYFVSTTAYVVLTFYLLLAGAFFYSSLNSFAASRLPADYEQTMQILILITVLITPLITMRLIAEERNKGTLESLLSSPITEFQIIISKYLSSILFYMFLLIPTLLHVYILSYYTLIDIQTLFCGYTGISIMACALFSIGLMVSALCSSQITAGIITLVISMILIFIHAGAVNLPANSILRDVLLKMSFINNTEPFIKGLVDTRTVVYFMSIIAICIYLATKSLELRLVRRFKSVFALIIVLFLMYNGTLVNYLSQSKYQRLDFTRDKKFELSNKSKLLLKSLDKQIKIYAVPPVGDSVQIDQAGINAWNHFREFMTELEQQSGNIIYQEPKPFEVADVEEIRTIFGGYIEMGRVYVVAGNSDADRKHKALPFREFYRGDPYTGKIVHFTAESKIMNAIRELVYTSKKYVYFTSGHREYPTNPRGLGYLFQYLKLQNNIEWRSINLQSIKTIPGDCEILCAFGAIDDFTSDEINLIKIYLNNGGRLLVTVESNEHRQPLENLDNLLSYYGIGVDRAMLFNSNLREETAVATTFPGHPINVGMESSQLYFTTSCSLYENMKASRDFKRRPIIISDNFSEPFYKRFVKETNSYQYIRGRMEPKFLGMISEPVIIDEIQQPLNNQFRIVVLASTSAFTGNVIRYYPAQSGTNLIFSYFENIYKWLSEREDEIAAPPKSFEEIPAVIPLNEQRYIFAISIVAMPMSGILFGIITYMRRRK